MRLRFRALPFLIVTLCLIAVAVLAVHATQASAELGAGSGYAAYHNEQWHFSLVVPEGMVAAVYDHPGGEQTIQFLDADGEYQFQISALPYAQLDLTLDRVGAPSGASDQPDHLEIVDVMRDDVFTVYFTKNGVQYVVVTMPELESWLIDILKTWEFTD